MGANTKRWIPVTHTDEIIAVTGIVAISQILADSGKLEAIVINELPSEAAATNEETFTFIQDHRYQVGLRITVIAPVGLVLVQDTQARADGP